MSALQKGLRAVNVPLTAVQFVPTVDRMAVDEMLKMDQYIDVIIPRGGQKLIEHIAAVSRVPLFKHLAGLCHTYVHSSANLEMAKKIVVNAKMRRPGICGATEVLLMDQLIAKTFLSPILEALFAAGCEVRGDAQSVQCDARVREAAETDFNTEFLDAIIAVKVVDGIEAAIQHIAEYGTQHTEAIIAEDKNAAQKFLMEVDSAIVMHNTSTQFADGGEFGMGAEIGIATGKLHARGPVGVEQLTSFKYQVYGDGQVRS
jgi:glutamate-5-semialdehyde dehydrogenase